MNCPNCNSVHYYVGVLGPDCATPSCKHFKNGKIGSVVRMAPAPDLPSEGRCVGYAVVQARRPLPSEEYLFQTEASAEGWMKMNNFYSARVVHVITVNPIEWLPTDRRSGLTLAARLYTIHDANSSTFKAGPLEALVLEK